MSCESKKSISCSVEKEEEESSQRWSGSARRYAQAETDENMQSKHVSCTQSDAVWFSQPQHLSSLRPHQLENCTRRFFYDRLLMNMTSVAALSVLDKVGKVSRASLMLLSKFVKSWTRIDKMQARLLSFSKSVKSWTRIDKLEAGMGCKHNLADDTIGSNLVTRRKHPDYRTSDVQTEGTPRN